MQTGRIFEIAFAINAAMQSSFSAVLNRAGRGIQLLGAATMAANQQLRNGQTTVENYSNKLKKLQTVEANAQKFKELSQAIQNSGQQTNRSLASQARQLERVKGALEAAGFSVANFSESEKKLRAEIERTEQAEKIAANAQAARMRQMAAQQKLRADHQAAQLNFANAQMNAMSALVNIRIAAAPFISMVETAMNFEAAMSKVKAITNATTEETEKLTAKARELGETTRFSATQSAEAMSYLGMAGWKTEEILAGMKPMLDLASAGGTDLARTADILSDDLTAFGLTANDVRHMADVFAYTISNSNTTVEMMGESMKYAAPVAKAYGATMEETAAMIGIMANAGIKASQAGTSLRAGFLRLAGPPKKAAKELEALGINLSDAQREMEETQATLSAYGIKFDENLPPQKKMVEVIKQLSANTQGLSNEQRLAALSAIFGTNAASGWLNVIDQGPEKLDEFINALNNCDGEAERMSATMEDNAKGAATRLNSAIESLSISIGSAFLPAIADAADGLAGAAGEMAKWAGEHPAATKAVLELGAGLIALYGYMRLTALASAAYQLAIATANASTLKYVLTSKSFTVATKLAAVAQWAFNAALAANPVGLVVAGIIALVAAGYWLISNWDKVKEYMAAIWDSPAAAVVAFLAGPIGWIIYAAAGLISHWDEVEAWFTLLWNDPGAAVAQFTDMVKNKFAVMKQYVLDCWQTLKNALAHPLEATINFVTSGTVVGGNIQSGEQMRYESATAGSFRQMQEEAGESAAGGIFRKPYLTWVAEAGSPEAIVPLDGSRHAVSLWQQAGQMLGMLPQERQDEPGGLWRKAGGISSKSAAQNFAAPPISINLTFNGPTDAQEVQTAVERAAQTAQRSFADQIAELMKEKERLSYA